MFTHLVTAHMPWGDSINLRSDLNKPWLPIEIWDEYFDRWRQVSFKRPDSGDDFTKSVKMILDSFHPDYYAQFEVENNSDEIMKEVIIVVKDWE